jgi:alkanesulfonate monooxygenase SsuD/methylene tetrahydromethanopterin reductase-like flavin-dependent oxidoreductase (luciferase family)
MTLDLGVFLPTLTAPGADPVDVIAAARHAEALGFESVWVVDQLVAGTGVPILEATTTLAAVAAATTSVRLAYGVAIAPLRPVAWLAKEVATLQHLSGDRVLLGIGVGGDRHQRSWAAAGVPRRERGRRTDAALEVLPDLIAGKAVDAGRVRAATPGSTPVGPDDGTVQLAPGATVPPIVVGGMSPAAIERTARYADDWFLLPVPPALGAEAIGALAERSAALGRPLPRVTASLMAIVDGDPAAPDHATLVRSLVDPDGLYGMPADAADGVVLTGGPEAVAMRFGALADLGAGRVVVTVGGGDWFRQTELLAEARRLLPSRSTAERAPDQAVRAATTTEVP